MPLINNMIVLATPWYYWRKILLSIRLKRRWLCRS